MENYVEQEHLPQEQAKPDPQPAAQSTPSPANPRSTLRGSWKDSFGKTMKTMDSTETVTGTHRQTIDAALMGICITFLIALLATQPKTVDADLSNALIAFAVALPLIAAGYLYAAMRVKAERKHLLMECILIAAWIIEALVVLLPLSVYSLSFTTSRLLPRQRFSGYQRRSWPLSLSWGS